MSTAELITSPDQIRLDPSYRRTVYSAVGMLGLVLVLAAGYFVALATNVVDVKAHGVTVNLRRLLELAEVIVFLAFLLLLSLLLFVSGLKMRQVSVILTPSFLLVLKPKSDQLLKTIPSSELETVRVSLKTRKKQGIQTVVAATIWFKTHEEELTMAIIKQETLDRTLSSLKAFVQEHYGLEAEFKG